MKRDGGRFILGVETVAGLVAGASALVAFVAALVLWLITVEAVSALEASALSRAAHTASSLGSRPTQAHLEDLTSPWVPGGGVAGVAVILEDSLLMAYPQLDPLGMDRWEMVSYTSPDNGYTVAMVMELPPLVSLGGTAAAVLAFFAAMLAAVAIMMPRYLRKSVLEPLRSILGQADRIEKGGGRSASAAGDSFRRLVDLLARKDIQLNEMREKALKRAETAESRSGAVLEAMGSSVVVFDTDLKPTLWNSHAEQLLGPAPDSWIERDDLQPLGNLEEGEWDRETGGRNFRYSVTEGRKGERVLLITDVTDSLALERRLSEETALADLGAFSGGVAHEIGNALCALEGFIQLLARGGSSRRNEEILREASMEVESARRVVETFRQIASESSVGSSISVSEARSIISALCSDHGVSCSLEETASSTAVLPGSAVIMTRILDNLLSNAVRHAGRDKVSVTAGISAKEDYFVFSVEDRGPGLPDDPEIVFRPMYTTQNDDGGMGLGLTIARRLVRAMGGSLEAASAPEGGAVFRVSIPLGGKVI